MPITYQRLGNSGGGMDLEISAYPNTNITLSSEHDTYIRTTGDAGKTVFKDIRAGTYTASCSINGKTFTKEIVLIDQFRELMPNGKIKDLPLNSKLKFSSGLKMILMNKNLSGHPSNSATLVSEFITEPCMWKWNQIKYSETDIHKTIMPKYYNELTQRERTAILKRNFTDVTGGNEKLSAHFYMLTDREIGGDKYRGETDANVGFSTDEFNEDKKRKKRYQGGTYGVWGTRSFSADADMGMQRSLQAVTDSGQIHTIRTEYNHYSTVYIQYYIGIVPACDISQDAYVALDSDGYYRILGM